MTAPYDQPTDRAEAFELARESPVGTPGPRWQQACDRLANDTRFATLVISVILLNALTLGVGTFAGVEHDASGLISALDHLFLGFFSLELLLRLAAVGFRPDRFLQRGWNMFDLLVVGSSFVPGLGSNATALRLVRLLRVARLLSVLPDVRILLDGLRRAARPAAGILLLTVLVMYLYGIVGWSLFGADDPDHWGNIGVAFLTLFQLLTLDQWPDVLEGVRHTSPYAIVFILSFILLGGFVIVELLVGVVITSLDEALRSRREELARTAALDHTDQDDMASTIAVLRAALDDLEQRTTAG